MGQFCAVAMLMVRLAGWEAGRLGGWEADGTGGRESKLQCSAVSLLGSSHPPTHLPTRHPPTMQVLFIFVFALIGLQVFGQQSNAFDPPLPSFLGFWNAFVLVFQVLTLEASRRG